MKTLFHASATLLDGTCQPVGANGKKKELDLFVDEWLASGWSAQVREVVITKVNPKLAAHHNVIVNRLRISWK